MTTTTTVTGQGDRPRHLPRSNESRIHVQADQTCRVTSTHELTDDVSIAELERENRELRRANEILKSASASFAFLSASSLLGGLARFFAVPAAGACDFSASCRPPGTVGPFGVT